MARLVAFPYYGGKYYQLNWLLPLLPKCNHYVEPFCGSAIVCLNREPSPIETINDTNGDLVNFFKVLRSNSSELLEQLELTLNARDELAIAIEPTDEPLERARRFFVRIRQSFDGSPKSKVGQWSFAKIYERHPKRFRRSIPKLIEVIDRVKYWQIDNRPAINVIRRNDTVDTLFYCDPPYVADSRVSKVDYGNNELSDTDHRELANVLHNVKGKVAISGHRCDLYKELYGDWVRHDKDCNLCASNKTKVESKRRVDSVWCNYKI